MECTFQLRKLRQMLYHSLVFNQIIRTLFELFYFFNPLAGNGNLDVGNFILSKFNQLPLMWHGNIHNTDPEVRNKIKKKKNIYIFIYICTCIYWDRGEAKRLYSIKTIQDLKCSLCVFPISIYIALYLYVSRTVLRKNRNADFLYVHASINISSIYL